jgi:hypothetical protein
MDNAKSDDSDSQLQGTKLLWIALFKNHSAVSAV